METSSFSPSLPSSHNRKSQKFGRRARFYPTDRCVYKRMVVFMIDVCYWTTWGVLQPTDKIPAYDISCVDGSLAEPLQSGE